MLSNALDIVRNNISKMDNDKVFSWIINLNLEEQEKIIRLMLLDYYKLYYSQTLRLPEIANNDIENIICDPSLIYKLIKSTKLFNDMDFINKSILVKMMEEFNQDNNLINISPLYLLDKLTYKIVDDINCYEEYYLDYIKKNNHVLGKREIITEFLSNRVLELKNKNYNKYEMYILGFIKEYYKWKLFIKNHEGDYLLNPEDFEYIEKIETLDLNEILNELENDYEFLNTVIGDYLHYKTSKLEIKEDIVDNYLKDNTNLKIKQKLKINLK